jgi:hypothetical protein
LKLHALIVAALIGGTIPAHAADAPASDPAATALAHEVMEALGGQARWDALPGLRWSYGAEVNDTVRATRRHAWNKHTGWHRVEGLDRAGNRYVIIHNLNDGAGRAWVAGQTIEGDSLRKLIERGKNLWVNDAYWMLMPYKMLDPGVILSLEAPVERGGKTCDRIAMRFENVGLTPGDRYWVDIERDTRRVCAWEMVLQGQQPPPRVYTWEGWEEHDGLWFPTARRDGTTNVFTRDVVTVREFPASEFTAP